MSVTLSLAAFVATFFPMLVVGMLLGMWCRRVQPKKVERVPEDLRKTVAGDVTFAELVEEERHGHRH